MDGDPNRGLPPSRDRLTNSYDPYYRNDVPARHDPLRSRPHPDDARRYPRLDPDPPPQHSRPHAPWQDRDPNQAQFGMREAPPPRAPLPYHRHADPIGARSTPFPPMDLPRSSRPIHADDYYAPHPSTRHPLQEGAVASRLHTPRLTRLEGESHLDDPRASGAFVAPEPRDLHRPSRPSSGDPNYADAPLYPARPSAAHSSDFRTEAPLARASSPVALSLNYPSAPPPPRRISDSSDAHIVDSLDASFHRDKRARLEAFSDRAPTSSSMLQPPPSQYRTAPSRRPMPTAAEDWSDSLDLRDRRRSRDPIDTPYHGDLPPSRSARAIDWVDPEKGQLSRRTSGVSYQTLESGHDRSEASAFNSQSSKVKRRKRAVLSCTECKQRKIKCDRNVPNCGSCVRRGVAHLCRWGDERDFLPAAPASNITPSNAALMARIAQLESQIRVLQSSSSSPSAANDHALSERNTDRHALDKHDHAATSSGSRSSRFSGPSSIQNPPNFTSRERKAYIEHARSASGPTYDTYARHGDDDDIEEDESDQSEDTDSAESGAENAGDLLQALARGTSLKRRRRGVHSTSNAGESSLRGAPDVQEVQRDSSTRKQDAGFNRTTDHSKEAHQETVPSSTGPRRASDMSEENLTSAATFNMFVSGLDGEGQSNFKADLLAALELLPSRPKTKALIEIYLREAEPIVQSIHQPSLLRQYDQLCTTVDHLKSADDTGAAQVSLPDLQFVALILAICEGACEFMTPQEVLESGIGKSRNSINSQLVLLGRTSLALLGKAKFVRSPNIWGLQTIIALRHFCFNRDHREEYIILYTMAIKAAELLGLHRLGSALVDEERWEEESQSAIKTDGDSRDPASAPSHRWKMLTSTRIQDGAETDSEGEDLDPDQSQRRDLNAMWLPRGSKRRNWDIAQAKRYKDGSRVDREVGRKVWFAFATMDWHCAAHFDRCYSCKDEMFSTQSPQNIDDADVTDSESLALNPFKPISNVPRRHTSQFLERIRAVDVPTTNSFIPIHIEICHTVRSIADAQNLGDESFETVLAIEARFREILRSLPRFFRLDGQSEYDPEVHRHHRERPYLSFQRAVIHAYVHHRLLKLHRLYMSRGYWNPKYIHSTRTCIESARVVIGVLRALDHVGCRGQRYWIFKFNIFHAVLALQVDLLYLARLPVNREILAKRADVVSGLKMLHARTDVEGRNPLLASSLQVIKVLSEEEKARRTKNAAGSEAAADSEVAAAASSSPGDGSSPTRKSKSRGWTGASESTGDLAEHLERRIKENWCTVEVESLRARAEANSDVVAEASPKNAFSRPLVAISRTPSTEDGSSLHTVESDAKLAELDPAADLADTQDQTLPGQERRDSELEDYLKLLSSYQNPDDAPDGAHFFDVLDDLVYQKDPSAKLPTTRDAVQTLPLLRTPDDLAVAGAGFDAFTAA